MLRRAGHTEAAVDLASLAGHVPRGGHLRGDERGRHDGAPAGARARGRGVRPEADLDRGPDRVPPPQGGARGPGGRGGDPDGVGGLPRLRVRQHRGRAHACRPRLRGDRRRGEGPHPRPLRVPDRRRLRVIALRLRPAARGRAGEGGRGGPGCRPVHARARGPRDRPDPQAARLRAPGSGSGHGGGQYRARLPGGPARLRHRSPDPGGARRQDDASADQQSGQAGGAGGVRPFDR